MPLMPLTKTDRLRLKDCEPNLTAVILELAKDCPIPFKIMQTKRSLAQQKENIKKGVSWTLKSKHLPGKNGLVRAADIVPIDEKGQPIWSWGPYHKLRPYVQRAADKLGIRVKWGGTWKENVAFPLHKKADGPHWELV